MRAIIFSLFFSILISCSVHERYILQTPYDEKIPASPDYSKQSSWCALPDVKDEADEVPDSKMKYGQDSAQVDVFFVHPTTFTYAPEGDYKWNADVSDEKLNKLTDETTIKYQASVFNVSCRVYAPRYRQAHISAFYTLDKDAKRNSLDTAYADVKKHLSITWNTSTMVAPSSSPHTRREQFMRCACFKIFLMINHCKKISVRLFNRNAHCKRFSLLHYAVH